MRTMMTACVAILLALSTATATHAQATPPQSDGGLYHVAQVFHVGGKGNWDYLTVDPNHKRLLRASQHTYHGARCQHGQDDCGYPRPKRNHGVALVPGAGRGFITDGQDGSVVVFDLKTNEVLGKVKTAEDADAILYDPTSGKIW